MRRVFVAGGGTPLRRQNFRRVWIKALAEAGLPSVHFHDLRHTGNTLAAGSGASLRELMARMGHPSTRAAVIYQHASAQRDRAIAQSLNNIIEVEQNRAEAPAATAAARETPPLMAREWHAEVSGARKEGTGEAAQVFDLRLREVETRGLEPLTPALQRQCSAS